MRKIVTTLAMAGLLLGGCGDTARLRMLGDALCADAGTARDRLDQAELDAARIGDPVAREARLGLIRTARAALDKRCGQVSPPG